MCLRYHNHMAIASSLSAFATAAMTLQYYTIKRLLDETSSLIDDAERKLAIDSFVETTFSERTYSRVATWVSLALFLAAQPLLILEKLPVSVSVASCCTFGTGALLSLVFYMWWKFKRSYQKTKELSRKSIQKKLPSHTCSEATTELFPCTSF